MTKRRKKKYCLTVTTPSGQVQLERLLRSPKKEGLELLESLEADGMLILDHHFQSKSSGRRIKLRD